MNSDLIAFMALAGGIAAIVSLVFAAATQRSSGTTKVLGIFISVSFLASAIFVLIIATLLATMQFGVFASIIVYVAFTAIISIITAAVVIYRLFPDEKPTAVIEKSTSSTDKNVKNDGTEATDKQAPPI